MSHVLTQPNVILTPGVMILVESDVDTALDNKRWTCSTVVYRGT